MVGEPDFDVVKVIDRVEIRYYPSLILATVYGLSDNDAFEVLLSYISGNNMPRAKISMTAPVINVEGHLEKIPMTAPVITDERSLSFVMPSQYSEDTVPVPRDQRVKIERAPERYLAVLRFRGHATKNTVKERIKELKDTLNKVGLSPEGGPLLFRYNPPFTPGFLRRNEVAVAVSL